MANADVGELYKEKKPLLRFDGDKVSGSTGCNNFNGTVQVNGAQLAFPKTMAMTRMMCPGAGEQTFLQALEKVDVYSLKDGKLILSGSGGVIMQLSKK